MTSERWQQVNDLFQLAAERAPEERTKFLQTACQGDEGLRREVESLIAYYERAENFIESPAFEVVPELLTADRAGAIVGESIAHYQIESLIGIGGMGEVYLARDERLGRKVALKFLPEQLTANNTQLSRFKSEARAASALNHPNILTVYEIGTEGNRHFIATEFIEGVTLRATLARGRMSVHDALEVAVQVASALAAAHKTGVVHRDIKPENIMIRPDGYVKVLDFGLAKLTEQKLASDNQDLTITNTQHTLAGMLVGTPRYMSPEQTRGQPADGRSDIWSLGAVLYEMVGGVPAFSGATPSDCIAAILKTEAPPLSRVVPAAPNELQSVLHKALRKNRDERYQTIAEMLADLRSLKGKLERAASTPKIQTAWLWAAAVAAIVLIGIGTLFFARYRSWPFGVRAPSSSSAISTALSAAANIPEKSIAVLPFENRSRDPENAFFTDGVQDEILIDLARVADLKVISRTSVMPYKTGAKRNLRQIGNELGVAHVVEGGVQRVGNRVRVNAQLIDARTDAQMWAQTYDRDLADVFAIQSEIAKAIADQLQAKLSPNEKSEIEQPPTTDVIAFDFYSHAKTLFLNAFGSSSGKADLLQAADLLNQAVARDPSFFQAYCQLAFTQVAVYFLDFDHTPSRLAAAEAAVQMAARLQPDAGETHLARARNLYWGYSDYNGALAELEIARQRLPGDNWVFSLKGYIKRREGRWEESLRDLERAIALDPRNIQTLQQTARSYTLLHRYAESKSLLARVLSFEPNDPVTKVLHAFVELDSNGNARPVHEVIDSIRRTNPEAIRNVVNNWLLCALAQRDIAAAKHALAACGKNPILLGTNENVIFPRSFAEGVIARLNHDDDKVRSAFAAAQAEQEKIVQAQANYGPALCVLGLIDAALGRKEQALREGQRAVELVPVEKDALLGPTMIKYLAMIAAWVGDTDLACNQLAMLIRDPSTVSYGQLKLMPFWDPLRGDPRFEKLLEEAKLPVALSALESGARSAANVAPVPEKSIAVLPFENRSRDPDNAYFAEGIQDEILTRLSKIADLKVISRTSTQHYKSAPTNLPDIARQLGVAHILEGSVQKSGDAVRVNVQLIKAADDSHLWADSFDHKLTDIFSAESDVAKAIAEQLQVKLTGPEEQVIAAKPTDNPEAYDAYLRGLAYSLKTANTSTNALGAQKYLKEAVRLDPKFALAWALLSYVEARGYITQFLQPTVALREEAQQAAERAITLQPNLGEAILAKGFYHYACLKDYDTAVSYFEQARPLLPNSSRIPELLAYVTRRQGKWERSESYFNEAERLDPRNVSLLTQHALSYKDRRLFPEAWRKFEQILNITPDDLDTIVEKAVIAQAEGDLPRASALLTSLQPATDDTNALETQAYQAILERRPAQIMSRLKDILVKPDPALGFYKGELRFWLGWTQAVVGDHVAAEESWRQARNDLESFLKEQPENHILLGDLALTDMSLGDKAAALSLSEHGMTVNPIEKDAVTGPASIEFFARVAVQAGEVDRAVTALQKLLSTPYSGPLGPAAPLTPALLRLDPMFDPLRNDPRFQKIVEEAKEPVATSVPAKSIAVLPFENLSRDPDNAYFAEGVQDEILTRLSKIADLKVISRTSTQHYKSTPANVPEIAKQLGVAHILEGSVQKSGDAVRVNVQLIKAADDSHLWADTFDRKLTDIFSVESEVAKAIADQLRAKLTGPEEQVIAAKPTDNPEAYDAYLRGLAYTLKTLTPASALATRKYLKEALRLDPKFAHAWALLSYTDSLGYIALTLQPTVALREEAQQAAETALTLQPNLGEAMLAEGQYHYGCLKDYDTAVRYFEKARPLLPNDSRIPQSLASVTRRQGQWDRSESYLNEAERLDPRNVILLTQHALSYSFLRRFPEAKQKLDRVLDIIPADVDTLATKAAMAQAEGNLPAAAALLSPLRPSADLSQALEQQVYQAILQRQPTPMITRLEQLLAKPDPALGFYNGELRFWLGWAQEVGGHHAAAQESWRQARSELEGLLTEQPENHNLIADLALTNMGLGDKAAAFAFVEKGIAVVPIEKDAIDGTIPMEILARVASQMGEPDRAIAALQKVLLVPGSGALAEGIPLTPALLRLDPMFDPLRNDSRFQELVAPAGTALSAPAQIPEKSIAVLPFENRSRDPDNAFFTDGVQDEILTDLARVADLKVISRTSVMQYKTGAKRNLRQIGNELGVAHVVEGGVQRVGNRVRVNAQLIDARTDAHLWAQTYDRDLADVFAIQSEIAKAIADQLQAKISPSEKTAIEQSPTTDITAFNLYSHAKNLFLTAFGGNNGRDLLQAADLLKQAVARDPLFFQAYCQLAFTEINIYGVLDHTPPHLAQAEAALQSAARLRPDAGETHLARARNLYWGYLDYDGALRELEIARQSLPGEDWIFSLKGYIERRQGRWDECIRDLERATELDPRNVLTLQQLAITYEQLRRYAEEKSTLERILAFEPNDPVTKSMHAFVELDSKADTRPLHEVIDSIRDKNPAALSSVADNWLLCAFAERDPAAARKALIALGENPPSLGPIADVRVNRPFIEGIIATIAKDDAGAHAAFTAARTEQEKIIQAQPNYGPALCVLALADAALAQKERALRGGRRAVELCPIEKDAVRSVAMVKYLAMIAAWAGEKDLACEQLAIAIRSPGDLSYGQLKLMPFWDPIRSDPRFGKIVASLAPKDQEAMKTVGVSQNDAAGAERHGREVRSVSSQARANQTPYDSR